MGVVIIENEVTEKRNEQKVKKRPAMQVTHETRYMISDPGPQEFS